MTYSKYLCQALRCNLRLFSSSFYSSFSFSYEKNIIFLHYRKIETDLKKQMTSIGRESIVGFHMTSLKFKLQKLSILLRSYFHDVLEQLKTKFHTNFSLLYQNSVFVYLPRFISQIPDFNY